MNTSTLEEIHERLCGFCREGRFRGEYLNAKRYGEPIKLSRRLFCAKPRGRKRILRRPGKMSSVFAHAHATYFPTFPWNLHISWCWTSYYHLCPANLPNHLWRMSTTFLPPSVPDLAPQLLFLLIRSFTIRSLTRTAYAPVFEHGGSTAEEHH